MAARGSRALLLWPAPVLLVAGWSSLTACGSPGSPHPILPPDAPDAGPPPCPAGAVKGIDDACVAVGVPDCAGVFDRDDDGLCRPSADKCAAGQLPSITGGCLPVGVSDCPVQEDGFCLPREEACDPGALPLPQGCAPISDTCPSLGDLPDIDVYVDQGADPAAADGTLVNPFVTITDGLAYARAHGLVRVGVAPGTYEAIRLDGKLRVVGVCPALVTVDGAASTPFGQAAVWLDHTNAPGSGVEGVRVRSTAFGVVADHAVAELLGVQIDAVGDIGVYATGKSTKAALRRVSIAGTEATGAFVLDTGAGDLPAGIALYADFGAQIDARDVAILRSTTVAVMTVDASIGLTRTTVADTRVEQSSGSWGWGVVGLGGSVTITESAIVRNREFGVQVLGDTTLTVDHSIIADTANDVVTSDFGWGIGLVCGATATVTDSVLLRNYDLGMALAKDAAQCPKQPPSATIERTLIADNGVLPAGTDCAGCSGHGLTVQLGGDLTVRDSALLRNREVALYLLGEGTASHVYHTLIADTRPSADAATLGSFGRGASIEWGSADFTSCAFVGNRDVAVLAAGGKLSLTTSYVADTAGQESDLTAGSGVVIEDATGTLIGNAIVRNRDIGLFLYGHQATCQSTGDYIAWTQPEEAEPHFFGHGVVIDASASMDPMVGAILRHNTAVGMIVSDADPVDSTDHAPTRAIIRSTLIEGTQPGDVVLLGASGETFSAAEGLRAQQSFVDLSDSRVQGNVGCGIIYYESTGTVTSTVASGNDEKCDFPAPTGSHTPNIGDGVVPEPTVSCAATTECGGLLQTPTHVQHGP